MNDLQPDPHLGQALAHAPDREAAPPPHVSAHILAAAHREASAPAPRPVAPPPRWRGRWGASGALATVLLAGFIGILWRGDPPGPAVDGPAPVAAVPAVQPAGPVAPAASAAAVPPVAPAPPAKAMARAAAPAPAREAAKPQVVAAAPAPMPAPMTAATPALEVEARARAEREAQERQAKASADAAERSVAERRFALPSPAHAPVATPAPTAAATAAPSAAPTAAAPAPLAARPPPAPLPQWQAGDLLAWDPASAKPVPDGVWLQQLAGLADGAWAPSGEAPPTASRLTWHRHGAPLGVLQWSTGVVWWCAAGQSCLRAGVPPDALRGLVGQWASER